jgi:DnaK suppressor protein
MLSQEQIEKFKNILIETKKSLEAEIQKLETPLDVGDFPGEDDNVDESEATFNNRSAAASLREVLGNVESALLKIEKGEYGICENCGKEISPSILEISAESRFCQECNLKQFSQNQKE